MTASNGNSANACSALVATSVARRFHRSARLPPSGPSPTPTTSSTRNTAAVESPDRVSTYTKTGKATPNIQSPTLLTVPPNSTNSRSRSRQGEWTDAEEPHPAHATPASDSQRPELIRRGRQTGLLLDREATAVRDAGPFTAGTCGPWWPSAMGRHCSSVECQDLF